VDGPIAVMNEIPCLCINLDRRPDRWDHVQVELEKLGYVIGETAFRFSAKYLASNPAAGCSLSHLQCLQLAKLRRWPQVFICEDDISFLYPDILQKLWGRFRCALTKDQWDVLLIAGNNMMPFETPADPSLQSCCIQVHHCLTTTGYIIQAHYYDQLIANIRQGVQQLMRDPSNKRMFSIDRFWFHLQERDRWYFLIPATVVQREGFSDIEGKHTDFREYMLKHNKAYRSSQEPLLEARQDLSRGPANPTDEEPALSECTACDCQIP